MRQARTGSRYHQCAADEPDSNPFTTDVTLDGEDICLIRHQGCKLHWDGRLGKSFDNWCDLGWQKYLPYQTLRLPTALGWRTRKDISPLHSPETSRLLFAALERVRLSLMIRNLALTTTIDLEHYGLLYRILDNLCDGD